MTLTIGRLILNISFTHVYFVIPYVGECYGELVISVPGSPRLWTFDRV